MLGFSEISLFLAWTILLNYFLSKFFPVSLHFMCLVFVQDIEEPFFFFFFVVVLLGTMFGTLESARIQKKLEEIEDLQPKKKIFFFNFFSFNYYYIF